MIINYLKNQNRATVRFTGLLLGIFSKLFGLSVITTIGFYANVPSDFYTFLGIHFFITTVMVIKEGYISEDVNENSIDITFMLLSFINISLFAYCLSIINNTLNISAWFNYLFIAIVLSSVIRFFYVPSFLKDIAGVLKKYKEAQGLLKEGKLNQKFIDESQVEETVKRLSKRVFPVLMLPTLFILIVIYWFYIKALIIINPGFLVISCMVVAVITESVFDNFTKKTRKVLIEKSIDDGNE